MKVKTEVDGIVITHGFSLHYGPAVEVEAIALAPAA